MLFARVMLLVEAGKMQALRASMLAVEGILSEAKFLNMTPSARAKAVRHICLTRLHMLTLGLPRVLASLMIEARNLLRMASLSTHIKNLLKIRYKYYYTTIWKKMQKNKKLLRKKHKMLFKKYLIFK